MNSNIELEQIVQWADWKKIFEDNPDYFKEQLIRYDAFLISLHQDFNISHLGMVFSDGFEATWEYLVMEKIKLGADWIIEHAFESWFEELSTFDFLLKPYLGTGTPMTVQKELINTYPDIVAEYATDDYKQLYNISE